MLWTNKIISIELWYILKSINSLFGTIGKGAKCLQKASECCYVWYCCFYSTKWKLSFYCPLIGVCRKITFYVKFKNWSARTDPWEMNKCVTHCWDLNCSTAHTRCLHNQINPKWLPVTWVEFLNMYFLSLYRRFFPFLEVLISWCESKRCSNRKT